MPATILSVAILLVLLGPGFCFAAVQDRRFPARDQSPFHEAVAIGAWSILLNALVVGAALLLAQWHLITRIDAIAFAANPRGYWLHHFELVNWWVGLLLGAACALGLFLGLMLPANSGRLSETSWWKLAHLAEKNEEVWVGVELDNGGFVQGRLWSYNPGPDETADRDLIIRDPKYRSPKGMCLRSMNVSALSVSARSMRFVLFSYLDADPARTTVPGACETTQGEGDANSGVESLPTGNQLTSPDA